MSKELAALEWSLVQAFLAVAEEGSLSGAARVLKLSQPTLGRHMRALEEQLGAELFQRHERGLSLTKLGEDMTVPARAMREAAHGIALRAAGKGTSLAGSVRITASEVVAQHHLPSMLATIRSQEPQISVDVVPSDETSSLHYREADIAIRMYRPKQLDLIAQQIGTLPIVACAARAYLKRRGEPKTLPELLHHDLVGMDRHTAIIDGFRLAGVQLDREAFKARTDDSATYLALVRAGCGIGFAQRAVAAKYSDLIALKVPLGVPPLTVWLTAHETIRHAPRVSRVWNLLEAELRKVVEPAARRKKVL